MREPADMTMKIIKGPVQRPQKVCVYGPEGVGKTSFAARFPKPLFLDLERGSCAYAVDRVYPETYGKVEEVMATVLQGGTGYETLVVDTFDALWQVLGRQVAAAKGVKGVEEIPYGKGVAMAAEGMTRFFLRVDALVAAGVHVVVLAHSEVKKHEDAEAGASYDRYMFRVQKLSAHLLMQEMDSVLFANFETRVVQDANGKARGVGGKQRVLHTVRTASHDGKNRLGLPEKMSLCGETVARLLGGQHPWEALVAGFTDEEICGFLVKSGYLGAGEDWRYVAQPIVERGVAQPGKLRQAMEAYKAGVVEVEVPVEKQVA